MSWTKAKTKKTSLISNGPISKKLGVFLEEFASLLESVVVTSKNLIITGDFNIHVDKVHEQNVILIH
jgi:exonuclease III